jgi:hypothetical protein
MGEEHFVGHGFQGRNRDGIIEEGRLLRRFYDGSLLYTRLIGKEKIRSDCGFLASWSLD